MPWQPNRRDRCKLLWSVVNRFFMSVQTVLWQGPTWIMGSGLILGLRPANERRRYKVTPSLIGREQT